MYHVYDHCIVDHYLACLHCLRSLKAHATMTVKTSKLADVAKQRDRSRFFSRILISREADGTGVM